MEIGAKEFIKIMNKNFGFKIVKTKAGKGIQMDPFSAFTFSLVTGSGYLDNPIYPFTPKGLMKVFYNALDYKVVTGLFDNSTLKNTPYLLSKAKKFIFNSEKIIIPVEFRSDVELKDKLKKFVAEIDDEPTKYIIQRVEKSKKGNGMEPFMEYLACEVMRHNNFIVETQIPLSHSTGSPDFGGYKLELFSNIPLNQIHLIELAFIRLGKSITKNKKQNENKLIVGEAKTSRLAPPK